MKKICYVLTSNGKDIYANMNLISACSLRITNPDIKIVLFCDTDTYFALNKTKHNILDCIDEIVSFNTPRGTKSFINRFIKTNLRSLIAGPFLFLDADVLIRSDISAIFNVDADIAAARNHSKINYKDQIWEQDAKILNLMGWKTFPNVYINGGVLYCKDNSVTHKFWILWHKYWNVSLKSQSYYRDQPSLNSALHESGVKLAILPDSFNAQFKTSPMVAKNAKIWHYYSSSDEDNPITQFEIVAKNLFNKIDFDQKIIANLISSKNPWKNVNFLDNLVAHFVIKRNRLDKFSSLWFKKNCSSLFHLNRYDLQ